MKRVIVLLLLGLFACAPAHATGVALRWNSCEGAANRNFACDRSTGSELLVGSFQAPPGITQMSGIQVYLRVAAASNNVPSWWQMSRGGCRPSSLSVSFDMADQVECSDTWDGQAMGGIARYASNSEGGMDVLIGAAVPQSALRNLDSGRTYAAFKLMINHQKSGSTGCEGCSTPMCIRFEAIRLVQPGRLHPDGTREENYVEMNDGISGMSGASNIVTWQGGASGCNVGGAKPTSWRQLKDLYRSR